MAINLSDSIRIGQQKPIDDKYYNGLNLYASTTEANSSIDSAVRYIGLTVAIDDGSGGAEEYWYQAGIADIDLVAKTSGGGGSSTFTGLTDTPSTYSGQSGKLTQVNSAESAVEFTDTPTVTSVTTDYVAFNTSVSPEPSGVGEVWWSADHETLYVQLDSGEKMRVGQDHYIRAKNTTASAISKGRVVKFTGGSGDTVEVGLADGTSDEPYTLVGVTAEDINAGATGFVAQFGIVDQFDVAAEGWSLNDLLYVNPASPGTLTNVKPSAPNWNFPIAAVTNDTNAGRLEVRAIPGAHLSDDLIDVNITSIADGEILQWNAAGGYWENQTLAEAGIQPAGNYLTEIKQDTTPQLGGDLDLNNSRIISVSNQDIEIIPDGTGRVTLGNFVFKTSQVPSGTEDNYVLTYDDTAGTIQLEAVSGGGGGTVTEVTASTPLSVVNGTSTPALSITQATSAASGYLSNTDWNTFSGKLSNIVDDTTPQLGGNLDVNGKRITSSGGGNIQIVPDPGGNVEINGLAYPTTDGTAGQAIVTDGAGTLAFTNVGSGTVTSVTGSGTSAGLTLTGSGTSAVTLTLGGTLDISADTTPQLGGTLDANNNDVTNVDKITAKEFVAGNQTVTSTAGVVTVDAISGTFVEITLSEDITTFNVRNMVKGEPLTIMINTGAGAFAVSGWQKDGSAPNFLWSGGTAPTITTTASKVDIVTLICDGTNIYASAVQDF